MCNSFELWEVSFNDGGDTRTKKAEGQAVSEVMHWAFRRGQGGLYEIWDQDGVHLVTFAYPVGKRGVA